MNLEDRQPRMPWYDRRYGTSDGVKFLKFQNFDFQKFPKLRFSKILIFFTALHDGPGPCCGTLLACRGSVSSSKVPCPDEGRYNITNAILFKRIPSRGLNSSLSLFSFCSDVFLFLRFFLFPDLFLDLLVLLTMISGDKSALILTFLKNSFS